MNAKLALVAVLALVFVAGACGGSPTGPSSDGNFKLPPAAPPEAAAPPGTTVVTITAVQLWVGRVDENQFVPYDGSNLRVGDSLKGQIWIFVPRGQGGMKPGRDSVQLALNGQVLWAWEYNANTNEGYSGAQFISDRLGAVGDAVYVAEYGGAKKEVAIQIVPR